MRATILHALKAKRYFVFKTDPHIDTGPLTFYAGVIGAINVTMPSGAYAISQPGRSLEEPTSHLLIRNQ